MDARAAAAAAAAGTAVVAGPAASPAVPREGMMAEVATVGAVATATASRAAAAAVMVAAGSAAAAALGRSHTLCTCRRAALRSCTPGRSGTSQSTPRSRCRRPARSRTRPAGRLAVATEAVPAPAVAAAAAVDPAGPSGSGTLRTLCICTPAARCSCARRCWHTKRSKPRSRCRSRSQNRTPSVEAFVGRRGGRRGVASRAACAVPVPRLEAGARASSRACVSLCISCTKRSVHKFRSAVSVAGKTAGGKGCRLSLRFRTSPECSLLRLRLGEQRVCHRVCLGPATAISLALASASAASIASASLRHPAAARMRWALSAWAVSSSASRSKCLAPPSKRQLAAQYERSHEVDSRIVWRRLRSNRPYGSRGHPWASPPMQQLKLARS